MRRIVLTVALIAAADAALSLAAANCTCRAQGRDYELGTSACVPTPKGARIATCGMVLNNTSWQFTETPCVVSRRPPAAPSRTGHDHAHSHHHGGHGG